MDWLFKLAGLVLIFSASSLAGFLKSLRLKKRHSKLSEICRSLSELKEHIRLGAGETGDIVNRCFEKDTAVYTGRGAEINPAYLEKPDIALLREFFDNMGMADADAECGRTELYIRLFETRCGEAEKKCGELCRLYNTLGVLCGVFLCIFFL